MNCLKCKKEIPNESAFCMYCGAKQTKKPSRRLRGNGTGTAYKRGSTWTARVCVGWKRRPDGSVTRVERTKGGFKRKTDALDFCRQLLNENYSTKKHPIEKLYEEWLESYSDRISASTKSCYTAAWKYFEAIEYKNIEDITTNDLQKSIDQCPAGKRTKQNMRVLAGLLYKYAFNAGINVQNRAQYLYAGNDPQETREAFTRAEMDRILAAVSDHPYAAYVYCMCYLGFRPGEMLDIKKASVHLDEGYMIGGSKTEAGTDRIVTIPKRIMSMIRQQYALNSEYLFPRLHDMKHITDNYFRKSIFDPLMAELRIENRVPYSCRHTYANLLKDAPGADDSKAALMGHSDITMTRYYQSASLEDLKKVTDNL